MLPPLRFQPLIKRLRWGGTRLGKCLGKQIGSATDAAESWEIVDHGTDQSVVLTGRLTGWSLARIISEYGNELLGYQSEQTTFPLLLKFLDAHDRLSLQVHPNDEQATRLALTGRGKTEAWYIIEAHRDSLIYAGLKSGTTREELARAIESGTITNCVHAFQARPGDSYLIPAGTVHAIGEGVLLAEVQQTCDITFRLHDWGRLGADGQPRQLHVREALECIDFARGPVAPRSPLLLSDVSNNIVSDLVQCPYFVMRQHQGTEAWTCHADNRFHIFMVLQGRIDVVASACRETLAKGETVLIPASCRECQLIPHGKVTILEVFVPDAGFR